MKARIAVPTRIQERPKVETPYSWDLYRDGITQSALATLQLCPEKFRLAYIEGLATNRFSVPIEFGNIFHATLDKVYTSFHKLDSLGKANLYLNACIAAMHRKAVDECRTIKLVTVGTEQQINEQYAIAAVVLKHYLKRWFDEDKRKDWVSLEQQFRQPFKYGDKSVDLLGKVDGVYRMPKGLEMLETKTKGQIDEETIMDKLPFDFQVYFYFMNASALYKEQIKTVCYNVARRPLLRQKKDEDMAAFCQRIDADIEARPDFYFVRFRCTVTKADIERWGSEFKQIIAEAINRYDNDLFYRRSTSCDVYGRCPFLKLCGHGNKAGLVKRQHAFPELQEI